LPRPRCTARLALWIKCSQHGVKCAKGKEGERFAFILSTKLGDKNYVFEQPCLDVLGERYDAGEARLRFSVDPEA